MLPLQCLTEALVEVLLYKANEGGREGGFLEGLCPQSQADPGCLLQEEEYLVSIGVDSVISQEHRAKDGLSLELGRCLIPACNGGNLLLPHNHTRFREGTQGPTPQYRVPLPRE